MKIALVVGWEYDTPPPKYGGVELVVGDLADELVRRGHDVFLLAPGTSRTSATLMPYIDRSVDRSPDIKHEYHLWAGQHKLHCLANIRRLLADLQPDVIHSHIGALLLPFAPDFRCPIVTTEHWELTEPIDVVIRQRYPTTAPLRSPSGNKRRSPARIGWMWCTTGLTCGDICFKQTKEIISPF